jgi:hypothetical protein
MQESTVGQAADSDAVERELKQIVQELAIAWKRGQCDAWGAYIAPEWSVTHISGAVITKPQAMQMCQSQTAEAPLESLTSDELSVRVYGDTAVVTGRTIAKVGGASPQTVTLRFTDVYVRRSGRWQAVASQATQLAP